MFKLKSIKQSELNQQHETHHHASTKHKGLNRSTIATPSQATRYDTPIFTPFSVSRKYCLGQQIKIRPPACIIIIITAATSTSISFPNGHRQALLNA